MTPEQRAPDHGAPSPGPGAQRADVRDGEAQGAGQGAAPAASRRPTGSTRNAAPPGRSRSAPRGARSIPRDQQRSQSRWSPYALLASARGALEGPSEQVGLVAASRGWWARSARVFVRLVPLLLVLGGYMYNTYLPPTEYNPVPLFVAGQVFCAPFYGLPGVIIINVLGIGGEIQRSIIHPNGGIGQIASNTQLFGVILVFILAVVINRVVKRGDVLLTSARQIATAAQRAVLPEPVERLAGLDVATHYEAATAGAFIGGDLYAVQDTPHGIRVVVGDVRGKGMDAVAAVGVLIGAFREAAEQESSLEAVAQRLDRALSREGSRRRGHDVYEEFATVVLAEIAHGHDVVRIVNRGHPWPLLLHGDGRLDQVVTVDSALPLGMSDLGIWPDHAQEIPFPRKATLLLYTDGLTEARNQHGVFYDPVAGLQGRAFKEPDALLEALMGEVRRHTGDGATDDLALLALRRP